ncbi:receptor-like protein 2 [Triticum dicoccoides]|uniref:receptor-like protein 2 n=1 Tax=Triticum dicoccoides TaxID=85692 RepID=UPI001891069A|nr:receptor-like protein 2 [Triticum dicoccoides]
MQPLHFPYMEYSRKLTFFALVLLISLASPISSCTEKEKGSLLQFLSGLSSDGGLTASWKQNGADCCEWEGVTCGEDGAVTGVSLALKGLEGRITPSLGNLVGLLRLNLSHNSLSGGLPLELVSSGSIIVLDVSFNRLGGDMQELPSSTPSRPLQVLNISSNLFTGRFPSSTTWEVMDNLVVLNASNNSFTEQIPDNFCSSSSLLAVVELCYNQFTGVIPPGLGNCSMLRVLKAGHNNLRGTLPNELFDASLLEYLSLPSNVLDGVLDGAQIIKLSNLVTLDLGRNNFSGKIPDSIGELESLEELHLDYNNMSGELPSALSNCTNLITINFKSNNLSGELSKVNFSTLPRLKTLDILYNNCNGRVPESLYTCSNLTALRLSGNNLHGQLSPRIGDLKHLTFLSLAMNSFTNITNALHILQRCTNLTTLLTGSSFRGELMPEDGFIDGFENLQVLSLNDCSLLGKIPLWISKLAKLEMLILSGNQLTGSTPAWIEGLKHLFYLDISNNSLTGEIPRSLMDMQMLQSEKTKARLDPRIFELPVYRGPSLQYRIPIAFAKVLDLSNNKLTGEIPSEIGQLKSLLSLNLSFNALTGQIPISVCNLTNLQVLDFSSNNLIGAIPDALNRLNFLSAFNISYNDLEGPIPSGGQFNTFQNSSFDGNPKLCGSMLTHKRGPASTRPPTAMATKQTDYKAAFAIAFSAFFGVGVLYDQLVLSRFFG